MYNENNSNDFYDYHTTSSKKDKLDKDNLIEILSLP